MKKTIENRQFICTKAFPGCEKDTIVKIPLNNAEARGSIEDIQKQSEFFREYIPNMHEESISGLKCIFIVKEIRGLEDIIINVELNGKKHFVGSLSRMLLGDLHASVKYNLGYKLSNVKALHVGNTREIIATNGIEMLSILETAKTVLYRYMDWKLTCANWDKK